ncbi:MAG: hypothetical protein Fur0042_31370 [Cyanophyceae cyanobacterium]
MAALGLNDSGRSGDTIAGPPLEPWGELWAIDGAGCVLNPCDRNHLQGPWGNLVVAWVAACAVALGDRAVGFYVRGSIPRGRAIAKVSDLDGLVMVTDGERPDDERWYEALDRRLRDRYPFCRAIKTSLITADDLINPAKTWGALLKSQGLWVAGNHLTGQDAIATLPPVRPGPALWLHRPTLHRDWQHTAGRLRHPISPTQVRTKGAWLNRRIVRTGFELVMAQDNAYTRDLYPCYRAFARHYPDRAASMALAARLAIAPSAHRAGLLAFWQEFLPWLLERLDQDTAPSPSKKPS